MSACAISFLGKVIIDIGAEDILLHIPQIYSAYSTYNNNLPKSPQNTAINLQECTSTVVKSSFAEISTTIVINIIATVIITLLLILGIILLIVNDMNVRIKVLFIILIILIWSWGIYVIKRSARLINIINIDSCLTNANRSTQVYSIQVDRAIQSGLCAY